MKTENGPPQQSPPAYSPAAGSDDARGLGPARATVSERLVYLIGLVFFAGVLVLALAISPDPEGIGTHTQLGLPPCGLYQRLGLPCLTCGMTTSFAHMVRFQVLSGIRANPLGAVLFVTFLALSLLGLYSAVTGWSLFRFLERRDWTRVGLFFLILALGSWAYKIAAVFLP
ncbi:MAG: DUF2752 domain-containing protein [Planctomycetota bacterium]|jgi:hypothetical protein